LQWAAGKAAGKKIEPNGGLKKMNIKNNITGILAIGLVALLFASTSYADTPSTSAASVEAMKVVQSHEIQPVAVPIGEYPANYQERPIGSFQEGPGYSARGVMVKPIAIQDDARRELRAKMKAEYASISANRDAEGSSAASAVSDSAASAAAEPVEVKRSNFRTQVRDVRATIVDYKKSRPNNEFRGLTVEGIVNATPLEGDQKTALLDSYKEMQDSGNKKKSGLLMWSIKDEFVGVGKVWGIQTEEGNIGKAVGFNNHSRRPFVFVWGSGFFAGVQGNEMLWGTYTGETFILHYAGGEVIEGNYLLYNK
jgi:hypothetical protein